MRHVNCGSCEYRERTRQYLQKKNAEMYYENAFFIAKRKQNEKKGINYLMRD